VPSRRKVAGFLKSSMQILTLRWRFWHCVPFIKIANISGLYSTATRA
jgi:hypothetical protein